MVKMIKYCIKRQSQESEKCTICQRIPRYVVQMHLVHQYVVSFIKPDYGQHRQCFRIHLGSNSTL